MVLNYLSHCTCINIVHAFTCTGSSLAYIFCLEHNLKAVTTYFLLITKWRSSVNYWPNFAFQSFYKKWKKKRKTTSKLANKERWSILAHICYFPLWSVSESWLHCTWFPVWQTKVGPRYFEYLMACSDYTSKNCSKPVLRNVIRSMHACNATMLILEACDQCIFSTALNSRKVWPGTLITGSQCTNVQLRTKTLHIALLTNLQC